MFTVFVYMRSRTRKRDTLNMTFIVCIPVIPNLSQGDALSHFLKLGYI